MRLIFASFLLLASTLAFSESNRWHPRPDSPDTFAVSRDLGSAAPWSVEPGRPFARHSTVDACRYANHADAELIAAALNARDRW